MVSFIDFSPEIAVVHAAWPNRQNLPYCFPVDNFSFSETGLLKVLDDALLPPSPISFSWIDLPIGCHGRYVIRLGPSASSLFCMARPYARVS